MMILYALWDADHFYSTVSYGFQKIPNSLNKSFPHFLLML